MKTVGNDVVSKSVLFKTQIIAALKSDKEALESQLYDLQQINAQLELRKEQLEAENQELLVRKENLLCKS